MRIAFIAHYGTLYGANRSLLDLIDGLTAYGVDCLVVCPSTGSLVEELAKRKIPAAVIPSKWWVSNRRTRQGAWRRLRMNMGWLPPLVTYVRAWDADIIYSNSSVTPVGAIAALILRRPHVWHLREMGDLHYGFELDWGEATRTFFLARTAATISVSEAVRSHTLRHRVRANDVVIYNGVLSQRNMEALYRQSQSSHPRSSGDPFRFCLIGEISQAKGQATAIRALSLLKEAHPNAKLTIYGEGNKGYTESLKGLCYDLGISDRVDFAGYIRNPFDALLASDALLNCSRDEAMGRVTAEAMAACRPVIGLASGATPELIRPEFNGLLYHDGPESLAAEMMRLLDEPQLARNLGQCGWVLAYTRFSIEVYAGQVHNVLQRCVHE